MLLTVDKVAWNGGGAGERREWLAGGCATAWSTDTEALRCSSVREEEAEDADTILNG